MERQYPKWQIYDEKRLVKVCKLTDFTSCRPDGNKKAYVRLAPDYDALDIANKVSIHNTILTDIRYGIRHVFIGH